jgi:hypothetical protein
LTFSPINGRIGGMFIYLIVNSENLKIYIGQHKGDNLQKYLQTKFSDAKHYRRSSHLFNAMRKYPRDAWSIHPLVSGVETKAELDDLERHFIKTLKVQHPDVGYNICDGGEGHTGPSWNKGKEMTPEYCEMLRLRMIGTKQSPETVEKRRAKQIGQKRTPEQAARISAGRKGKGTGDRNAQHRDGLSEGHRKKIGEANARTWTPERRQKQAEQMRKNFLK